MRNVILYDSHPVIIRGLRELFSSFGDDFAFFETNNINGISKYISTHKIHLIVAGINEKTDIDARTIEKHNSIPWVILYNDNLYKKALSLVLSGAMACLSKGCGSGETEKCILEALQSHCYICEKTLHKFGYEFLFDVNNQGYVRNFLKFNMERKPNKLSPREQEVANLLVSGMRTSEIAALLKIKHSTASTIKRTIMLKKNVRNIIELATVM
jgi:DNA-binding NarL/FixJ family response regulator